MYTIDVNFLNDRPEYNPQVASSGGGPQLSLEGQTALFIGGGVAATALGLVGVAWFYLTQVSIPQLEARQRDLDSELALFLQKEQELTAIEAETAQISGQTESLAGVFNFVTPWSAILQDLRDRTPPGVRINGIEQSEPEGGGAAALGEEAPPTEGQASVIVINGIASSFSDVSDLLVVLQQSNFFEGSATRLLSSEISDNPSTLVQASEARFEGSLGTVVEFEVETQLLPIPASSILGELEAKGATGLVRRIRRLQTRGVIE